MSKDFSFKIDGPLATLTFTRPDKANAFHPRMAAAMRRCFLEVQHNSAVRCLLINGEGKHFMAGGDLEAIVNFDKIKKLLYASFDNSMMEQGRMEAESYGEILHTEDVQHGLKAFFEHNKPEFKGR